MSNYLGPNSKWTYCNHVMMPTVDKALGFKPETRVDTNKDIPLLVYGFISVHSFFSVTSPVALTLFPLLRGVLEGRTNSAARADT